MKLVIYFLYLVMGGATGFFGVSEIVKGQSPENYNAMLGGLLGGVVISAVLIIIDIMIDKKKSAGGSVSKKILDTSVIIDGRISDLCETGFLEGTILLPKFVLHELQHIADSSDNLKRHKGRRGMEVLDALKKCPNISIEITDKDYTSTRQVDEKLVLLAKEINGKIITNDYNLNKVAEIQGVKVLNLNEISNAIKPVFLPGERVFVKVMKEGKEKEQGIAYLNDGTMIVIDHAKKMLNKRIEVVVTNVLQTDAGRMIFAKYEGN